MQKDCMRTMPLRIQHTLFITESVIKHAKRLWKYLFSDKAEARLAVHNK